MAGELGVLTLDMVARTVNFDQPLMKSEKQAEVSSKNIASSFEKIEKQSASTSKAVAFMGSSLKASIAAISISSIVSIADGYTQTAARIQNATTSTAEYDQVQKHLYETANGTYRSLKEAQEVYLGTSGGLKELGYNTQAVLAISDSLSYSFVHNATSVDKAQSAMDAYGKILDKGKVEADAWFSLMVAAPNILNDVSNATGKSTQEIRKLGAEGKLAAADLHKGLLMSRDANKALADVMVNSAADGGQKLSNAIERTVGELNKGSGATGIFAEGLGLIADNINLVSGAVAVGAVGYLTAAIVSKSAALKEGVISSIASRQATIAEIQAQVQATGVEALRQKQLVLLAASEINMARAAYNSATTATARTAAIQRLTAAEIAHEIQIKRSAVSTDIYTASQTRLAAAGRMSLGVLGGPVGLGIIVATVAAGYLMMRDNTVKATDSLASQIPTVSQLTQEYQKLNEQQLITERTKIKNSMAENREEIKQTINALGDLKVTWDLGFDVSKWTKYNSILEDLKNGAISGNEALAEFNKMGLSSPIIEKVADLTTNLDQNKAALDKNSQAAGTVNNQLNITANAANNAAGAVRGKANAMTVDAANTRNAAAANSEYTTSLGKQLWNEQFKNALITKHNKSQSEANLLLDAYNKNAEKGYVGVTAEQKKKIGGIESERVAMENRAEAQRKADQLATKSARSGESEAKRRAKEAASEAKRQAQEAESVRKEILQNQYDISYRYANRTSKMESDLIKEQSEIRKAYAQDPAASEMYLASAKQRHDDALKLYDAQLGQELYSFKMNEEEKLNIERNIELMRIKTSTDYSDEEKKSRIKALSERHNHEMAWLNLEQLQRLNDAQSSFQSDIQRVTSKYEFEREQIRLTKAYSDDMKDALIGASYKTQDRENDEGRVSAWSNYQGAIGIDTSAEDEQRSRGEAIQAAYDWQLITQEDYQQKMLQSEQRYFMAKAQLGIASMQTTMGGWADVFKNLLGESSSYYQAAFAMERGFAVAKAMVNAPLVYTETYAALAGIPYIGPYIAQPAAIAAAGLQVVQAGIAGNVGFYGGGYTGDGGKYEYAGPAHKGEVVFSQEDIKRWGGVANVEAIRNQRSIPNLSPKVGNGLSGREVKAQQASQNVNLNPNFVIVDEREKLGDYLYGPDGKKAFVKFFKQNRRELGLA
ncbi:hypothetical protein AY606_06005 [Acinetobacter sp. SFB]|uniref:tape measure protein n=1 Tax=Acinetobacter sp. SFB TaxID=1805634 RepID=UPI0007D79187|nr:tape measure protein [Acinetobacter sp. SFB]OAL78979.1 hypothetical protein AY606_06005 [Acinetobacter sp. SFB]